ncbi:MAG: lytic transglycosylase domain-containing protein [Bacteroidales bacterium]|nr:lytic transglycosylase domain-containing protein [Bacteroidales bacterium]
MKFYKHSIIFFSVLFSVFGLSSNAFSETDNLTLFKKKVEVVAKPIKEAARVEVDSTGTAGKYASFTLAPEIPDEISFCGQVIDLRKKNMHERFDREMLAMMYMHSSTFLLIKRANRFFPVIEPILKANGIPDDMKYLACIESGLNHMARSSANAIGMWQFMPATAIQYGLEVNDDVDERYHVEKETEAACRYLKDAYERYGDWPSAAASYNIGTARITKELARQGEKTSLDLWLVEETSRYVFRILTCKVFMTNPQKYGFYLKKDQLYMPSVCKDSIVTGKVANWVDFAKGAGISFYDLKNYNTWIRNDSLPNLEGKEYKVAIPLKESLYFDKKNITVHQKNWVVDEN